MFQLGISDTYASNKTANEIVQALVTSWAPISFQHCLQGVLQIVTSNRHPPYQTAIAIQTSLASPKVSTRFRRPA